MKKDITIERFYNRCETKKLLRSNVEADYRASVYFKHIFQEFKNYL